MKVKKAPWRDTTTGEVDGDMAQLFLWAFGIPFGGLCLAAGLIVGSLNPDYNVTASLLGAAVFFAACFATAAVPSLVNRSQSRPGPASRHGFGEKVSVVGLHDRHGQMGTLISQDTWESYVLVKFADGVTERLSVYDVSRALR